MQRITTREPSDDQLAIAICAIKSAVPELYRTVNEEEHFITPSENRHHIGNVGKKFPPEKPLYSLTASKVELYRNNANLTVTKAPIYAKGKMVNVTLELYKK
jgi:hypothetical protein